MHSRRERLRAVTRPLHAQVEAMIERSGMFDDREGYGRFLAAMHRFHCCAETARHAAADAGLAPGWRPPPSARLLREDLDALGAPPAPDQPLPTLHDRGAVLGLRYVVQGSALGATQLLPRALALGASGTHGAAFLSHHATCTKAWLEFCASLEATDLADRELQGMDDAACQGFELVRQSLRSRCRATEK